MIVASEFVTQCRHLASQACRRTRYDWFHTSLCAEIRYQPGLVLLWTVSVNQSLSHDVNRRSTILKTDSLRPVVCTGSGNGRPSARSAQMLSLRIAN